MIIEPMLPRAARAAIAAEIERLIAILDFVDGDPDLEELGIEDGFQSFPAAGPGCHFSDPGATVACAPWIPLYEINQELDLPHYAPLNRAAAARLHGASQENIERILAKVPAEAKRLPTLNQRGSYAHGN